MDSRRPFFFATIIVLTTPCVQSALPHGHVKDSLYTAHSKVVVVPGGKATQVTTDGMFSKGEWDDALTFSVAEGYSVFLMADREVLCVGLRSAKPIGELVSEMRITLDEQEVFLFHVSGALGEGVSGFPATTHFDLNNNTGWEANIVKADSIRKAAWIAAGRPLDRYDDVYKKRDGVEFKIRRKKFEGDSLKLTLGWIRVEVEGTRIDKRTYSYPEDASLQNADNWVELILPTARN